MWKCRIKWTDLLSVLCWVLLGQFFFLIVNMSCYWARTCLFFTVPWVSWVKGMIAKHFYFHLLKQIQLCEKAKINKKPFVHLSVQSESFFYCAQTWLHTVCYCRMYRLIQVISFLVFIRQNSQRSTWPPTSIRDVWWTCRSIKVAPKWSGKMLEANRKLLSFDAFTHAICNLPQWACTKTPVLFFPVAFSVTLYVQHWLVALREIKAKWLCQWEN